MALRTLHILNPDPETNINIGANTMNIIYRGVGGVVDILSTIVGSARMQQLALHLTFAT